MNEKNNDSIRILLVNDEIPDLEFYRDSIERHCQGRLEVKIFGPEEAGGSEVGRTLLSILFGETEDLGGYSDVDVLFIDYRMPDINGFDFLRLLRKSSKCFWY